MTVLIVTHSQDNESVELVSATIKQRGGRAVRFDTDLYPTTVRLSIDEGADGLLTSGEEQLRLAAIEAIWYRRVAIASGLPKEMDTQLRRASVNESRRVVFGLLAALPAFAVDRQQLIRNAESKALQLRLAREVGLEVPRSLTSNDAAAVRRFAATCDQGMVGKMLSSFAIFDEQGNENVMFTTPINEQDLAQMDGLHLCPMTFQERLSKQLELRVTAVGTRLFSAAIDSQVSAAAQEDWRRDGHGLVEQWQPYELPAEVAAGLTRLLDRLGLNYGAIDLVLTPDGRHVFLEINPCGEFFWLQHHPGLPIAEALADVLLDQTTRRPTGLSPG